MIVSMLLIFEKSRLTGFYLSFLLMVLFTAYIVIILNFTSFTPCSCGGVLEDLGWTEHLIFNVVFILLAIFALVCLGNNIRPIIFKITGLFFFGISVVVVLYGLSEKEIKRNNAFQRKYIPHGLEELGSFPLVSNAFYIAGMDDSMIYLGNYNAPLYLKAISRDLKRSKEIKVEIEDYDLPYKRVRIEVESPYFFVGDGTVPVLFKGRIKDWNAKIFSKSDAYFYQYRAMDSIKLVFTTTSTQSQKTVLGILKAANDSINVQLQEKVLSAQVNGTFDTDGMLLWDSEKEYAVYVYYYRNQYEVTNGELQYLYSGKTIDTIGRAQMDVAYYQKEDAYKLGKAIVVNRSAGVWGDYLYINSDRLGKFESEEVLSSASIIDCYNVATKEYLHSFYFYHQAGQKLREFIVVRDSIIGLVNDQLWMQKIKPEYFP